MTKGDINAIIRRRVHAEASIRAQGLVTQTGERDLYSSNSPMVNGTIYLLLLPIIDGDVIMNLISLNTGAGTAGASSPVSKVGLYDGAGTRLAVSADLATDWQSTGTRTNALATPYTPTAAQVAQGALYAAMLVANWTTPPTFARATTTSVLANAIGSGMRKFGTGGTAQTDLPATITPAAGTPLSFWVGAS